MIQLLWVAPLGPEMLWTKSEEDSSDRAAPTRAKAHHFQKVLFMALLCVV